MKPKLKLRLARSPLTGRMLVGYIHPSGGHFTGDPTDVTDDFNTAMLHRLQQGPVTVRREGVVVAKIVMIGSV
jgi:hypothetical protein